MRNKGFPANTNYPWSIVEAGDLVNEEDCPDSPSRAEDACIVDSDGFEVVGSSEWMRGSENFDRIILCVNACANLTDEQLKEMAAKPTK